MTPDIAARFECFLFCFFFHINKVIWLQFKAVCCGCLEERRRLKVLNQRHVIMTGEITLGHVDGLPNDSPAH